MNKGNLNVMTSETLNDSWVIYHIPCTSLAMHMKRISLEVKRIKQCFDHTKAVLLNDAFCLMTGSSAECTDITPEDYPNNLNSLTPHYFSDTDLMNVLYHVRVIEEGDTLPQMFDNYIYCIAERGKHTAMGYRKIGIIHDPKHYAHYTALKWAQVIHESVENEYISSTTFVDIILKQSPNIPWKNSVQTGRNFIYLVVIIRVGI